MGVRLRRDAERERVERVGCVTEDGALVHEDADVCVAGGVALQKSLSRGDEGQNPREPNCGSRANREEGWDCAAAKGGRTGVGSWSGRGSAAAASQLLPPSSLSLSSIVTTIANILLKRDHLDNVLSAP